MGACCSMWYAELLLVSYAVSSVVVILLARSPAADSYKFWLLPLAMLFIAFFFKTVLHEDSTLLNGKIDAEFGKFVSETFFDSMVVLWSALLGATVMSKGLATKGGKKARQNAGFSKKTISLRSEKGSAAYKSVAVARIMACHHKACSASHGKKLRFFANHNDVIRLAFACIYAIFLVVFIVLPMHVYQPAFVFMLFAFLVFYLAGALYVDGCLGARLGAFWYSHERAMKSAEKLVARERALIRRLSEISRVDRQAASGLIREHTEKVGKVYHLLKVIFLSLVVVAFLVEIVRASDIVTSPPVIWGEMLVVLGLILPLMLFMLDRLREFEMLCDSISQSLKSEGWFA